MLSNPYFLAKFRFDTAENEPAKNLQKFAWDWDCCKGIAHLEEREAGAVRPRRARRLAGLAGQRAEVLEGVLLGAAVVPGGISKIRKITKLAIFFKITCGTWARDK